MKSGISEIVGKTIKGVVVNTRNRNTPREQVFLIFDDGTYFEFYGKEFSCAGGVDKGGAGEALRYARIFCGEIICYPVKSFHDFI